jgi:hypothetical protein
MRYDVRHDMSRELSYDVGTRVVRRDHCLQMRGGVRGRGLDRGCGQCPDCDGDRKYDRRAKVVASSHLYFPCTKLISLKSGISNKHTESPERKGPLKRSAVWACKCKCVYVCTPAFDSAVISTHAACDTAQSTRTPPQAVCLPALVPPTHGGNAGRQPGG